MDQRLYGDAERSRDSGLVGAGEVARLRINSTIVRMCPAPGVPNGGSSFWGSTGAPAPRVRCIASSIAVNAWRHIGSPADDFASDTSFAITCSGIASLTRSQSRMAASIFSQFASLFDNLPQQSGRHW